jgi:hypothetical protein
LSAPHPRRSKPTLLAGGNPQIAKANGGAPVQAYIAAMPGWKRDVGRRLDAAVRSARSTSLRVDRGLDQKLADDVHLAGADRALYYE